jgi:bla regulator protein blaR1
VVNDLAVLRMTESPKIGGGHTLNPERGCRTLSEFTKRMVLDNTNLGGKYDINLKWFPGPSEFPPRPDYLPTTYQPDPNSPPLLTAIEQQLGLKLESQTGPVPLLIIDHVEIPSEN